MAERRDDKQDQRDDEQDQRDHPLRRLGGRAFESLIDQQIREAEAAGQFNDLEGAGRPLDLADDKDVPEELRLGFRMLKGAGYAPPWLELQKQIRADQAALAAWLAKANSRWPAAGPQGRSELRAEYERRIAELNRQIVNYNLIAPPAVGQLPLLVVQRELSKLGA